MNAIKYCYFSLVILRFILTLMPQIGYIHPDEFFQAPEVVYGDMLKVTSLKTWEFETDKPIRSIVFPYAIVGFPALLIDIFQIKKFCGTELFPYFLLVLPRLLMCLLSLLHDFYLYKISKVIGGKNPFELLLIFASSYVTFVFLTRTFSNSLEALCLTALVYSVVTGSIRHQKSKRQVGPKVVDDDNDDESYGRSLFIGVLFTCGSFVRPTFILFAFIPVMYWLVAFFESFKSRFKRILAFVGAVIVTSMLFVYLDTVYYVGECHIFTTPTYEEFKKMVFTPINFIMYNLDAKNLSQHGRHPKYLHFLINIPLMYSVLGVYGFLQCFKTLAHIVRKQTLNCSRADLFMLLSFIVPIMFLSLVPHQEPRFLIPVIFPLICLCGQQLYAHLVKYKIIAFVWVLTNTLGMIFFGFVHQGGIYPALTYFHSEVMKNPTDTYNIVFYHTYMPPRHLLAVPNSQKSVTIYDLAGSGDDVLLDNVQTILKYSHSKKHLYIVAPSTITISLININIMLQPDYEVKQLEGFFPHVSIEDMPPLLNIWTLLTSKSSLHYKMTKLKVLCSLNIYEIQRMLKS